MTRYELVGALYGQKQSGKCWSERLYNILDQMGFTRFISDPSVYKMRFNNNEVMILNIYMDDIITMI